MERPVLEFKKERNTVSVSISTGDPPDLGLVLVGLVFPDPSLELAFGSMTHWNSVGQSTILLRLVRTLGAQGDATMAEETRYSLIAIGLGC